MARREPSRMAIMIAAYRARATRAGWAGCDDPWADALAGEDGYALAQAFDQVQPAMEQWVAVRTAFFDRAVRKRLKTHPQVVLLGAGLDSRAVRLAAPGVRFFEVDHPASQRERRKRLGAVEGYPTDAAVSVPCDFENDDFLTQLQQAGFQGRIPAVVLWEGVASYLSDGAVRATMRRVAIGMHPESVLLFDVIGRRMVEGEVRNPADQQTRALLASFGEPLRWGTDDLVPVLFGEGFRQMRVDPMDVVALNLTGTYDRARRWRFQYLTQASVATAV